MMLPVLAGSFEGNDFTDPSETHHHEQLQVDPYPEIRKPVNVRGWGKRVVMSS